jgi:hypothetical protein
MVRRWSGSILPKPATRLPWRRAAGVTAYLKNGGTPEKATQMANHASIRKTRLYDGRREELSLDEVEKIRV